MPPLEKVKFSKGQRQEFRDYLHWELFSAQGDREDLESEWVDQLEQWRAKIPEGTKDYPYSGAPYSRDTEILTRLGWKRIDEVEVGEYVLTRSDEDGSLEWNVVQARPAVWCDELLHFESRTVDIMVSPAHTMIVEKGGDRGNIRRVKAKDMFGKHGYKIPLTGNFEGVETEEMFGLDAGDVAEFIGWYLAEGSTTNSGTFRLAQKKESGRRIIIELLNRLGFQFSADDKGFSVFARSMPNDLVDFIDGESWCHEKKVPKFFYGASPDLIKRLLYGMLGGDGYIGDSQTHYFTTSTDLADDVQALAQLIGLRASVTWRDRRDSGGTVTDGRKIKAKRKCATVAILQRKFAKLKPQHSKRVEYNDFAYCVTAENHAVYVRRNGKACWSGNSNLKVPLTRMHSDPVMADMIQTLHAADEFWHARARRGFSEEQAAAVVEGLRVVEEDFIGMREVNLRAQANNIIHGTGVYKSHWLHERKEVKDYNAAGEIEKQVKVRSQPIVDHVPLQRFYFPADAWSIKKDAQGGARWVAEKILLTKEEFNARARSEGPFQPEYDSDAASFVKKFEQERREDEVDEEIREQADYKPFRDMKIELFEVWAEFDVDGDGVNESVFVIWHQPTATILRALYNPFLHGKRPYEVVNFLPTQSVYGMGMAEVDEWAQKTMSKLVNGQVDNVILANTRMFSAPMGSGIQPGEPVYPGKIWLTEQGEQVRALQAGEVYPSLPQTIQQFMQMSERASGVSELQQGNIQGLPSRTPASTTLSLLQEGNARFDYIISNMRKPLGRLGMRVMQNLAQYHREDPIKWQTYFNNALGEEDGQRFLEVLKKPIHRIESGLDIQIKATSSESNRNAERQQFLSALQMTSQIYGQIIQTAQMAEQAPPGSIMKKTAAQSYKAGVELLRSLLERMDIQDADSFLPDRATVAQLQQQAGVQQQAQNGAGIQPQFGPLGGLQGAAPLAQAPDEISRLFGFGG